MKKLYTFLIIALVGFSGNAQIVNIPDANFKAKLLAANSSNSIARGFSGNYVSIDTNGNNQIEVAEALLISELNVSNTSSVASVKIANLTGLTAFSNMTKFYCYDNLISTLDVSGFINMTALGCDTNNISDLNITGLTNLTFLSCESNQITSLDLTNKPNLSYLNCPSNNISGFNLTGLVNLSYFRANSNPYSSLDFTGLTQINTIQCMETNISELDVSNLHALTTLLCGDNPNLVNIFMKNGVVESSLNLSNLPNLDYVCVDANQLTTIQGHVNAFSNAPNCVVNTYCSFVPGGNYYTIQANTRFDDENNGCDNGDAGIPFMGFAFSISGSNGVMASSQNGGFSIPVPTGSHTITPILEAPSYFTVSPASASVMFPGSTSPYVQDFCIAPNGNHNDLEIVIVPITVARPGLLTTYKILCKNKGTLSQNAFVSLVFDESVSNLVAADPAISSQSMNTLNWNLNNIQPFETRSIDLVLILNTPLDSPPLNGGDILHFSGIITGVTDETPADNTFILNQTVLNSLDPNDKTCLEGTTISPSMVGNYVHYVIRFENTGTANAQNIVVKDLIDNNKFDITTFVPLSGSAPFVTRLTYPNQVEFIFEGIELPFDDANNDGYVAFKIKTKPTLVAGNTFSNGANIYFDYNFPITTNTYVTTVQALGNQDFEFNSVFSLSPVPTKDLLTITTKVTVTITSVSIYNTLGQLVQVNTNPNETIDVSGLKSGSYFIKIISNKGSATGKFIKE